METTEPIGYWDAVWVAVGASSAAMLVSNTRERLGQTYVFGMLDGAMIALKDVYKHFKDRFCLESFEEIDKRFKKFCSMSQSELEEIWDYPSTRRRIGNIFSSEVTPATLFANGEHVQKLEAYCKS